MATPEERVSLTWVNEQDIKNIRSLMNNLESLKRKIEILRGQLNFVDTAYKQGSGKNAATFDKQHFERIKSDLRDVERQSKSMTRVIIGDLPTVRRVLNKMR